VLAAVGHSGIRVDESKAEIFYGNTWAYKGGKIAEAAQLKKLEAELAGNEVTVTVVLHQGKREAVIYTCDLTTEYVHINADYTT
jgi:glutamate N-acetyltransferase/amino-acid N-acetyltransferase